MALSLKLIASLSYLLARTALKALGAPLALPLALSVSLVSKALTYCPSSKGTAIKMLAVTVLRARGPLLAIRTALSALLVPRA